MVLLGQLFRICSCFLASLDYLVLNISDILYMVYTEPPLDQISFYDIKGNVGPRMAYVGAVIRRKAADIENDLLVFYRLE